MHKADLEAGFSTTHPYFHPPHKKRTHSPKAPLKPYVATHRRAGIFTRSEMQDNKAAATLCAPTQSPGGLTCAPVCPHNQDRAQTSTSVTDTPGIADNGGQSDLPRRPSFCLSVKYHIVSKFN